MTNSKNDQDPKSLLTTENVGKSEQIVSETQNSNSTEEDEDFTTYDDIEHSNVPDNSAISESNDHINENSTNERPTFNRTYDKNASNSTEVTSSKE